jgi:long-chain acyl-CoA synthetase
MPSSLPDYPDIFFRLGSETAFVQQIGYRTVRFSYREVAETAFQFAHELQYRRIAKGDRVMLWGPNSAEWVAAFWGCVLSGVVVVPMDDAASPDFAHRVRDQVGAKLMVCSREHGQSSIPSLQFEEFKQAFERHSRAPLKAAVLSADGMLQIVFTSGTTADPKGVVITHGNVLANIAPLETEIAKYKKWERFVHPVRFLNLLPLSHVFGQFLGMFLPPLMGGTVVFQDNLKPAEIISTVHRERVSVVVSVPRVLQSLKEKIERDFEIRGKLDQFRKRFTTSKGKHFLHRWWIFRDVHRQFGWKFWAFISGGAALDKETEEFWGRLGYAAIQGYGLTETTSLISVNHPFRLGKGSIGKVLAGREVKLAEDGEILVRGGGVTSGYWSGSTLQAVASKEGWYHTGDVGELDAQGNLYFKGRKKEVIVTPAGMNLYPEDLETALRQQHEVKDTVVIPLARGENADACAVLILRDHADPESVIKRANESLAEHQRMHQWFVWPDQDFPRTSTQKPKRAEIQRKVEEQFGQATRPSDSGGIAEIIARITRRAPGKLAPGANLESDLNLSSLDRVELLSALEDRYQVDLSETGFSAISTVGDLERIKSGQAVSRAEFTYPRWAQRWPVTWIRLVSNYLLLRPAVLLLGWPRVDGRENLRDVRGPVLVICNHLGDVDVGFVIAALPHRLGNRLATATGGEALQILRNPPSTRNALGRIYDRVRWTLGVSLLNLFPLPREAGFRKSFVFAGETVDRGYNVLVFPEGRHTEDGKLRPFRSGVGLLAKNLAVPIVPMRIDGLFEVKKAGRKFAWPGEVRIKIGRPVTFPPDAAPETIAAELQKVVAAL